MDIAYGSGRSSPWEPIIYDDVALEYLRSDAKSKVLW